MDYDHASSFDGVRFDNLSNIFSVDLLDKKAEYKIFGRFTSQTEEQFNTGNISLV